MAVKLLQQVLYRRRQAVNSICKSALTGYLTLRHHHMQNVATLPEHPFEEQSLPRYYQRRYYPVRVGQVFNDRYRVLAKLGFGAYSTVWLARDLRTDQYKSIKVCVRADSAQSPVLNEIKILKHLASCPLDHTGAKCVRLAEDFFEINGHHCIVTKPFACSLQQIQNASTNGKVPSIIIQHVLISLLAAHNWLQVDCGVVHLDISPQNIMMSAETDEIFERAEKEEADADIEPFIDESHPQPHPIYRSRGLPKDIDEAFGHPMLSDFGSARLLEPRATMEGWVMPDTYRAADVLIGIPWSHDVDLWSMGIMTLELLEGKNVFTPFDPVDHAYVRPLALAQYIAFMGLPPLPIIEASTFQDVKTCFDDQGNWNVSKIPIPETSWEEFITSLPPGDEKNLLIDFLKKIFLWIPAARATNADLIVDEWVIGRMESLGVLKRSDFFA